MKTQYQGKPYGAFKVKMLNYWVKAVIKSHRTCNTFSPPIYIKAIKF